MKEYNLKKYINNPELVDEKIKEFFDKKILFKQKVDFEEIKGHIIKAENDLKFVSEVKRNFLIGLSQVVIIVVIMLL